MSYATKRHSPSDLQNKILVSDFLFFYKTIKYYLVFFSFFLFFFWCRLRHCLKNNKNDAKYVCFSQLVCVCVCVSVCVRVRVCVCVCVCVHRTILLHSTSAYRFQLLLSGTEGVKSLHRPSFTVLRQPQLGYEICRRS